MEYHVIVERPVSQAIGTYHLSRTVLIRLLTQLHDELTHHAEPLRKQRDPEDSDCFRYAVTLAEGSLWHSFRFRINDVRASGYLFIEEVSHESGPGLP